MLSTILFQKTNLNAISGSFIMEFFIISTKYRLNIFHRCVENTLWHLPNQQGFETLSCYTSCKRYVDPAPWAVCITLVITSS